jgi:hypothetical protein
MCTVRVYGSFLHVGSDIRNRSHMLMHCISFYQEGPTAFVKGVKRFYENLVDIRDVKIIFVGDKSQFEKTRQFAMRNIHGCSVRSNVVISHLRMHKVTLQF